MSARKRELGLAAKAPLRIAATAVLLLALGSAASAQGSAALQQKAPEASELARLAQQDGHVRVIVLFQLPNPPNGVGTDPAQLESVKAQVAAMQDAIIAAHFGGGAQPAPGLGFERGLTRFAITPGFAITVTQGELEALAGDSRVRTINLDRAMPPVLLQSVPLIGMPAAYALGATGAGFAVAVLDTGVQSNHEFLAGKVVAEACFSNANGAGGGVSLCPNGQNSQTGAGAADSTTAQCISGGSNICQHGTHVSGIAAGFNTNPGGGKPSNGVAENGKILAVQIFTRINDPISCSPSSAPCVLSFTSDEVLGLDYVLANVSLPGGMTVASVNMSLGGGPNTAGTCDTDSQKPAIDNLRSAGVLTAIAAGNDGSTSMISHPACISTATAVGSTTKTDVISSFSNISNVVDVVAPGGFGGGSCFFGGNNPDILSSFAGTTNTVTNLYACEAGTSMATPHVAGAIAAIRTACPSASADAVEAALINTGKQIVDTRPGGTIAKPRIVVDAAVRALNCAPPPPPPPPPTAGTCTLASQLGDFNGDGRDDLLFRVPGTGGLVEYLLNGFQIQSVQSIGAVGTEFTVAAVADFNGDGFADILFRRTGDGLLSLYLMNGAQIISAQTIGTVGVEFDIVGVADFNGDGKADILFRRISDGMLSLFLMNGAQVVAGQFLGALGTEWRVRGVRDFNGDGRADVLFRRTTDGMLALYEFNGFQPLASQLLGTAGTDFDVVGTRDFDGNHTADMLFRRASDGMLAIYLMNGFQVLASQLIGVVGTEFTVLALGDVNGDGRADIVFRRTSDGLLSIFLMSGFQIAAAQFLGSAGTAPILCYGQPPFAPVQISER